MSQGDGTSRSQTVKLLQISSDQSYTGNLELTSEEIEQNKEIVCFTFKAFSAEARRDVELSDEEVALMGYEPKLDTTQQTQLSQLSAVASKKIREIAEICNAQLIADKELRDVEEQVLGQCIKTVAADKNEIDFDEVKHHLKLVISNVFSIETLEKCREQPSTIIIYLALSVYYCFNLLKKLLHRKLCTIVPKVVVQFICSSVTILVKRLAEIAFNHFIQQSGGWTLLLSKVLFPFNMTKWIVGTVGLVCVGVAVYLHLSE